MNIINWLLLKKILIIQGLKIVCLFNHHKNLDNIQIF